MKHRRRLPHAFASSKPYGDVEPASSSLQGEPESSARNRARCPRGCWTIDGIRGRMKPRPIGPMSRSTPAMQSRSLARECFVRARLPCEDPRTAGCKSFPLTRATFPATPARGGTPRRFAEAREIVLSRLEVRRFFSSGSIPFISSHPRRARRQSPPADAMEVPVEGSSSDAC